MAECSNSESKILEFVCRHSALKGPELVPDHLEQVGHEDEDVGALPDVVDVDSRKKFVQKSGKIRTEMLAMKICDLQLLRHQLCK